jgi:hypothetical protein
MKSPVWFKKLRAQGNVIQDARSFLDGTVSTELGWIKTSGFLEVRKEVAPFAIYQKTTPIQIFWKGQLVFQFRSGSLALDETLGDSVDVFIYDPEWIDYLYAEVEKI